MSSIFWSTKNHLSNYANSPAKSGIYLIGIEDKSIPISDEEDNYLGANFPAQFDPKYVGISNVSIRRRLSAHARGKGNKLTAAYIGDRNIKQTNLHYVYCDTVDTQIEHLFLIATINLFEWNVKKSEKSALIKLFTSIYEKDINDVNRGKFDYHEVEIESGEINKGS